MRPRDTNTWKAKVFCIEAREKFASAQRSCGFSCKLRPHQFDFLFHGPAGPKKLNSKKKKKSGGGESSREVN